MTTLYFAAVVVTYLANALYFGTKFAALSSARATARKSVNSEMQTRCCN